MSERHQDLTLNHRLESWVYPNALARTGASGFVPGDIGRISYQQDTRQYWRLTLTTPAWEIISSSVYASLQTPILANPTPTTSTTAVMMGLGATIKITPSATGQVVASICGRMNNAVAGISTTLQMWCGIVPAPAYGVPVTGTAIGPVYIHHNSIAGGTAPFNTTALVALAVGTQYWFDLAVVTGATGTAAIGGPIGTISELP